MGLEAIYQKPHLSEPHLGQKIYPYLFRKVVIDRKDQVWTTDITYIPLARGFMYLVAIIDWWCRYVLAWKTSATLDTAFCLEALEMALEFGKPEILNTDQGSQFTSNAFTNVVKDNGIDISMDGRGRCMDNIFTERLWRSLKYENVYFMHYDTVPEGREGIDSYFGFYNDDRLHQALKYRSPAEVYFKKAIWWTPWLSTGLPTAKSPSPAMLRERSAGGQDLAMDNPPLRGYGHINKNK